MKTLIKILLPVLTLVFFSYCSDSTSPNNQQKFDKTLGFFPLQIGNLWVTNWDNYTKITDTIRISGELFYKELSLIGGDAIAIRFLKIDENNNLIEGFEKQSYRYTIAKFNLDVGGSFRIIGDYSVNDHLVTVVSKTDDEIIFEYDNNSSYTKKYIKGFGLNRMVGYAIINGKEYQFND